MTGELPVTSEIVNEAFDKVVDTVERLNGTNADIIGIVAALAHYVLEGSDSSQARFHMLGEGLDTGLIMTFELEDPEKADHFPPVETVQ